MGALKNGAIMFRSNLSASEILGFPPSKPFNIKKLKRVTYRQMKNHKKVFSFYNSYKGDFRMNIKNAYILSYFGFAATGVAGYAYIANQNTNIAITAAGAALLGFYAAFRSAQSELDEKNQEENMNSVWRETGRISDRLDELEDSISQRVSVSDFDKSVEGIRHDFDAVYRHIDTSNEHNIRELQEEINGIYRRVDAMEESAVCEAACVGKRGK